MPTVMWPRSPAAPAVSAGLQNAPRCGGPSVTISGLNFNTADSSPTGGTTTGGGCSTSAWTSATSVRLGCASWSGTATSLTVSGIVGTIAPFSFEAPVVTFVLGNVPESGGTTPTIGGLNFAFDCVGGETSIVATTAPALAGVWCGDSNRILDTYNTQATITLAGCASLCTSYVNCGLFFWGVVTYNGDTGINRCALFTETCTATTYAATNTAVIYYRPCGTYVRTGHTCATSSWTSATAIACTSLSSFAGASMYTSATVSGAVGTRIGYFTYDGMLACVCLSCLVQRVASIPPSHEIVCSAVGELCNCCYAESSHERLPIFHY